MTPEEAREWVAEHAPHLANKPGFGAFPYPRLRRLLEKLAEVRAETDQVARDIADLVAVSRVRTP